MTDFPAQIAAEIDRVQDDLYACNREIERLHGWQGSLIAHMACLYRALEFYTPRLAHEPGTAEPETLPLSARPIEADTAALASLPHPPRVARSEGAALAAVGEKAVEGVAPAGSANPEFDAPASMLSGITPAETNPSDTPDTPNDPLPAERAVVQDEAPAPLQVIAVPHPQEQEPEGPASSTADKRTQADGAGPAIPIAETSALPAGPAVAETLVLAPSANTPPASVPEGVAPSAAAGGPGAEGAAPAFFAEAVTELVEVVAEAPKRQGRAGNPQHKPWTAEDDSRTVTLWNNGASAKKIADTLRRTMGAVVQRLKLLRERGVKLKVHAPGGTSDVGGRGYTPEDDARILAMRKEGRTFDEIANELGRTGGGCRMRHVKLTEEAERAKVVALIEAERAKAAPVVTKSIDAPDPAAILAKLTPVPALPVVIAPAPVSEAWSIEDDLSLAYGFADGQPLAEIAALVGRDQSAVKDRWNELNPERLKPSEIGPLLDALEARRNRSDSDRIAAE